MDNARDPGYTVVYRLNYPLHGSDKPTKEGWLLVNGDCPVIVPGNTSPTI